MSLQKYHAVVLEMYRNRELLVSYDEMHGDCREAVSIMLKRLVSSTSGHLGRKEKVVLQALGFDLNVNSKPTQVGVIN